MKLDLSDTSLTVFKCLASETRLEALRLLSQHPCNVGELANRTGVSSAIMTRHIAMMEKCGIVQSYTTSGLRGMQKVCSLSENEIIVSLREAGLRERCVEIDMPVGGFEDARVSPACGLMSSKGIIGVADDSRYFLSPDRMSANVVWFHEGYLEYRVPLQEVQDLPVARLQITFWMEMRAFGKVDRPGRVRFTLGDGAASEAPVPFKQVFSGYTHLAGRPDGAAPGAATRLNVTGEGMFLNGEPISKVNFKTVLGDGKQYLAFRVEALHEETESVLYLYGADGGEPSRNIRFAFFAES